MVRPSGSEVAAATVRRGPAARARRRRAAIAAARDVFVAHGYQGANMAEISALAGMSKPVLYEHFTSKLDLYLTVLQQDLDRMVAGVRAALTADTGYRDRVRRAVLVSFDFVEDATGGHLLVFESAVPSEPAVQWRVGTAMRECAVLVSAEIRAVGVTALQADTYAWGLVGASHHAARDWLDAGKPLAKSEAVDSVVALFWSGLSILGADRIHLSRTGSS